MRNLNSRRLFSTKKAKNVENSQYFTHFAPLFWTLEQKKFNFFIRDTQLVAIKYMRKRKKYLD